jgi:uncharacterized protein (DUF983 family)
MREVGTRPAPRLTEPGSELKVRGMASIVIETDTSQSPRERPKALSMRRGFRQTCPACGQGKIYSSYLKIADQCPSCGEELHHHQADDAPPYFTILIVGHIIGGGILWLETQYAPDTWVHYAIWLPLLLVMTMTLLPRIKGALVGLQWALRMHGFEDQDANLKRDTPQPETP